MQGSCNSLYVSLFLTSSTLREWLLQGVSLFSWHTDLWKSSASYCSQKSHSHWWCQTAIFSAQEDQQVNWSLLRHHASPELLVWGETGSSGSLENVHVFIHVQLCRSGKRKCRLIRNRDTYSSWILLAGVRFSASPSGKCICVQISVGTQEIWAYLIVLWAQWGLPFHLTDKWLIKKVRGREGAGRNKPQYCPITETFKKMEERYSLLTG